MKMSRREAVKTIAAASVAGVAPASAMADVPLLREARVTHPLAQQCVTTLIDFLDAADAYLVERQLNPDMTGSEEDTEQRFADDLQAQARVVEMLIGALVGKLSRSDLVSARWKWYFRRNHVRQAELESLDA
jgi:hypothetical protein